MALVRHLPPQALSLIDTDAEELGQDQLIERVRELSEPSPNQPTTYLSLLSDSRSLARLAKFFLGTEDPQRALRVLRVARVMGIAHMQTKELYQKLAFSMAEIRRWDLILELDQVREECEGRVSGQFLNFWTRALLETRRFSQLPSVLRRFRDAGLPPNRRTFGFLISAHLRNHDLRAAIHYLDMMQKQGIPMDADMQATVAAAYRSFGADPLVRQQTLQALHDATPSTSTFICNALLQLAIESDDREWIGIVLELLRLDHIDIYQAVNPDGTTFLPDEEEDTDITMSNAAIRAATTLRITRNAFHVLPDVATYTILIHFSSRHGDLDSALSLTAHMHRRGLVPDPRFLAALVRVMMETSHPIAALRIVADLAPKNHATQKVLKALVGALAGQGDIPLPPVQGKPTIEIFNAFASGILPLLHFDGFQHVLKLMHECGIHPNGETVKIVGEYCDRKMNAHIDILAAIMRRLLGDVDSSRFEHCEILFRAIFRRAKHRRGVSAWITEAVRGAAMPGERTGVLKQIVTRDKGHEPTAGLGLNNTDFATVMDEFIRSLAQRGVLASRSGFLLRMRYEAARADARMTRLVFNEMLERGMHPQIVHYHALLDAYVSDGDMDGARAAFQEARDGGIRPDVVMYTTLIAGYARSADTDLALNTFGDMIDEGIRPDLATIDAIVSASVRIGDFQTARQTSLSLWPDHIDPPSNLHDMTTKQIKKRLQELWLNERTSKAALSRQERVRMLGELRTVVAAYFHEHRSFFRNFRRSAKRKDAGEYHGQSNVDAVKEHTLVHRVAKESI